MSLTKNFVGIKGEENYWTESLCTTLQVSKQFSFTVNWDIGSKLSNHTLRNQITKITWRKVKDGTFISTGCTYNILYGRGW